MKALKALGFPDPLGAAGIIGLIIMVCAGTLNWLVVITALVLLLKAVGKG